MPENRLPNLTAQCGAAAGNRYTEAPANAGRRATLLIAALCAAFPLAGCESADTVRDARGKGIKRTFRQPFEAVYQAVLNAASERKLTVLEQDAAAGRVLLASSGNSTSFGEHIAVFVTRSGERATVVEIVSRAVAGVFSFSPDWPALLFGDIDQALTARRPKS